MSERKSSKKSFVPPSRSLLNYFSPASKTSTGKSGGSPSSGGSPLAPKVKEDSLVDVEANGLDSTPVGPSKAKKRRVVVSSDSEPEPLTSSHSDVVVTSTPKSVAHPKESPFSRAKSATLSASGKNTPRTPLSSSKNLSRFACQDSPVAAANSSMSGTRPDEIVFKHLAFDFLKANKLKDAKGRPTSHPDFDERTLFVPKSFLDKQTPGHQQWWQFKSMYYDSILFFKVGKFYELYHMDAVTCVQELNLVYMKGDYAHAGFPETSYPRYCDQLIQKGYKVARIEQTETPAMLETRNESAKQKNQVKEKVVRRELCRITTPGTQMYGTLECQISTTAAPALLISICHRDGHIGVCLTDTATGQMDVGQFVDDEHFSRLRTLLAHRPPKQILLEKTKASKLLRQSIECVAKQNRAAVELLKAPVQFWPPGETLVYLAHAGFYDDSSTGNVHWPEVLKAMQAEHDSLGLTPKPDCELALSALGATCFYLKECLIEHDILTMRKLSRFTPVDDYETTAKPITQDQQLLPPLPRYMIMDSTTLHNLDVVSGSEDRSVAQGSLFQRLNCTRTAFGSRLFLQWICAPLCDIYLIRERQSAVSALASSTDFVVAAQSHLGRLPDLDRLLQKIHSIGLRRNNVDHPDARAVMFENNTYNRRKIHDFLNAVSAFHRISDIAKLWGADRQPCAMIDSLLHGLPDSVEPLLTDVEGMFDFDRAKSDGVILPEPGVVAEYDEVCDRLERIQAEVDDYLREQQTVVGTKQMAYFGTGRNRLQIEVPESHVSNTPVEYTFKSQRKGYKRYTTVRTEGLLAALMQAEMDQQKALHDNMSRIFARFDENYATWSRAIEAIANLDVLIALSEYSRTCSHETCLPDFEEPTNGTFIEIEEGIHPCADRYVLDGDFIANSICLGGADSPSTMLLTGPNMGGKSTLMRQVATTTIMAQLGAFVPARRCRLTPVDRLFTRLGAKDKIFSGQSTFYVEMSECSSILRHATPHSLIVFDELGRGTSTQDGFAIAGAVLRHLAMRPSPCRTLFSTHYHQLLEEKFLNAELRSRIFLGHMSCIVDEETEDPSLQTVTFLYKLVAGASTSSYGFNVARLAGMPDAIVRNAVRRSKELHDQHNIIAKFKSVLKFQEGLKN